MDISYISMKMSLWHYTAVYGELILTRVRHAADVVLIVRHLGDDMWHIDIFV